MVWRAGPGGPPFPKKRRSLGQAQDIVTETCIDVWDWPMAERIPPRGRSHSGLRANILAARHRSGRVSGHDPSTIRASSRMVGKQEVIQLIDNANSDPGPAGGPEPGPS